MAQILGWLALAYGVGIAAPPLVYGLFGQLNSSYTSIALPVAFGAAHIISAVASLRGSLRAFWVLNALFLLQSIEYVSESFSFSLIGPVSIKLILAFSSSRAFLGVNVLAIVLAALAAIAASRTQPSITRETNPGA